MVTGSLSKGRAYQFSNRLGIPFPYARVMGCFLPSRQGLSFRFHSFPLCLLSTLLLVMLCAVPLPLQGQADSGTQACGGNSTVDALGAKTAAGRREVEQQGTDCGDDRLPVIGPEFSEEDPYSEEAGIPVQLQPYLYGSGA